MSPGSNFSDSHLAPAWGSQERHGNLRFQILQQLFITEVNTVDMIIKGLLDREEIRNLRTLYAHLLDSNNIASLDQVFSIDAVVEVTVGKMEGINAIKAGLNDAFQLFDRDLQGSYPFMHAISNHWVELTGPDTAQGRCYLIDFETASKPDPNPLLLLGLYVDQYKRIDGQWRITATRLEVVWPQRDGQQGQASDQSKGA